MQVCPGYKRDEVVFLSEGWRPLGTSATGIRRPKQSPGSGTSTSVRSESQPLEPVDRPLLDTALYSIPAIDRSDLHVGFFLKSLGKQPTQTYSFIGDIFRQYISQPTYLRTGSSRSPIIPSDPTLFAIDALTQGHFGTVHADSVSVRQSFQSYGKALRSMSTKLTQMKHQQIDMPNLSEDDWQHFAFFCIVMAMWEVRPISDVLCQST